MHSPPQEVRNVEAQSEPSLFFSYLTSFIGKNLSSHLAYANGLARMSTYGARMATESTMYSSTYVDLASAPTVVGDTDDAAFVAAAHDGQNERLSARLQDGHTVLYRDGVHWVT